MARATAIETRLEKLLPAMEEYFTSGFLTREETHEVARQRSHWEYRLVAKPLLLLDVRNAARYELELEERLRQYCVATKLVLRHRWSIIERVEYIYRIGLRHIKDPDEWELLRREYVSVLKKHRRYGQLSALYGELMVRFPTRSALWVEAALYEGVEAENASNARALVQQAVLTSGAQPEVWNAAVVVELYFTDRLLKKLLEDKEEEKGKEHQQKQKQQVGDEEGGHDIVTELKLENAALAEVVVDLALVHAVVEEALDSPAFGPKLVRMLVDSVARFCYTKPVLERLMELAAKKMVAILSPVMANSIGNSSSAQLNASSSGTARQWTEVGISHFLEDYLALEAIMAEKGVAGDAASLLRSNGRTPSVGREDWKVSYIASLVSSLTLLYTDEVRFPTVSRLHSGAVSVVENLMERLQQLGCAGAVSAACRCLLLSTQQRQHKGKKSEADAREESIALINEVLSCLWKEVKGSKKKQKNQTHDAAVERVVAMLTGGAAKDAVPSAKKAMKRPRPEDPAHVWRPLSRFLLPEDRAAVRSASDGVMQHCTSAEVDLLFSLHDRDNETDAEVVGHAVVEFLQRFELIPPTAGVKDVRQLSFTEGRTPIVLWKMFLLLERCCAQAIVDSLPRRSKPQSSTTRGSTGDSDSDSDSDKKDRLQQDKGSATMDVSFAAAGLRFLAGVPCGVLPSIAVEEERLKGCWTLVTARVHTLTGLESTTRDNFVSRLRHPPTDGAVASDNQPAWVNGLRSILSVSRLCHPLPRQVYADIAVPFFEALALWAQKQQKPHSDVNAAVQEARDAHTCVLAMYTQSRNLANYMPLVYRLHPPNRNSNNNSDEDDGSRGSTVSSRVSATELNAADWARCIAFERDVAKDLRRAKEVSGRARRETLAPQHLLLMLNKY